MSDLIGSNGWAGSPSDICMWREMGISWGRDSVGPGQRNSPRDAIDVSKTGPGFDVDLPSCIRRNNENGIRSLLLLGYTPVWNASVAGDSKSAPRDVKYWTNYVEAVVRKYSAAPYNVKHFQVWNEAAGRLSGGLPQATFWHGAGYSKDPRMSTVYDNAMQDYVDRIHLPAAAVIRAHKCFVVYGGWPDQGRVDSYVEWLEYRSASQQTRMIDNVDYLDTHYLSCNELDGLYARYVQPRKVRGIWQTEIGDRYMLDPHFLPRYLFSFAVWALTREWNDPDKYVSMIYHWDGYDSFRLTRRGPPRTFNLPGRSLIVLSSTVRGALSPFNGQITSSEDRNAAALYSDDSLIAMLSSAQEETTVQIRETGKLATGTLTASAIDALSGARSPAQVERRREGEIHVSYQASGPLGSGANKRLSYLVLRRKA
ncbi:hypothetical protein [Caballeronia grimmiae]|uniref:hypothetical protein n=1 Tax=Caballeronia grimmiae TaxID=1071679 RepID=UPI0038BB296D